MELARVIYQTSFNITVTGIYATKAVIDFNKSD
jgi:hypothetical protein